MNKILCGCVTTSDTCGDIQSLSFNEQKVNIKSCMSACFSKRPKSPKVLDL